MWGDLDRAALAPIPGAYQECQGWEHTYDEDLDTWSEAKIWTSGQSQRGKSTSCMILDEGDPSDPMLYFTSDAGVTGSNDDELGLFKVRRSLVGTLSNWQRFYTPTDLSKPSNMFYLDDDNFILWSGYASEGLIGGGGFFSSPQLGFGTPDAITEEVLKLPGDIYWVKTSRLPDVGGRKRFRMIGIPDYDYYLGAYTMTIEFD